MSNILLFLPSKKVIASVVLLYMLSTVGLLYGINEMSLDKGVDTDVGNNVVVTMDDGTLFWSEYRNLALTFSTMSGTNPPIKQLVIDVRGGPVREVELVEYFSGAYLLFSLSDLNQFVFVLKVRTDLTTLAIVKLPTGRVLTAAAMDMDSNMLGLIHQSQWKMGETDIGYSTLAISDLTFTPITLPLSAEHIVGSQNGTLGDIVETDGITPYILSESIDLPFGIMTFTLLIDAEGNPYFRAPAEDAGPFFPEVIFTSELPLFLYNLTSSKFTSWDIMMNTDMVQVWGRYLVQFPLYPDRGSYTIGVQIYDLRNEGSLLSNFNISETYWMENRVINFFTKGGDLGFSFAFSAELIDGERYSMAPNYNIAVSGSVFLYEGSIDKILSGNKGTLRLIHGYDLNKEPPVPTYNGLVHQGVRRVVDTTVTYVYFIYGATKGELSTRFYDGAAFEYPDDYGEVVQI